MLTRTIRTCSRGFKSWVEYKAEQADVTVQDYLDVTQRPEGGYAKWREQVKNEARLNYVLDHCTEEDAKRYLAEFRTEDLAEYLIDHVRDMPKETVHEILTLPVQYNRFALLNPFSKHARMQEIYADVLNCKTDDRGLLDRLAEHHIESKLKELVWSKIDEEAAAKGQSSVVAQKEA